MSQNNQKRSKISELLYSNRVPVTSFDIEATGAVGAKASITQVGYTTSIFEVDGLIPLEDREFTVLGATRPGYNSVDDLSDDLRGFYERRARRLGITVEQSLRLPTEEDYLRAHEITGAGEFGRQQLERGSFSSFITDFEENLEGFDTNNNPIFRDGGRVARLETVMGRLDEAIELFPGVTIIQNVNYENSMMNEALGVSLSRQMATTLKSRYIDGDASARNVFKPVLFDSNYRNPVLYDMRELQRQFKISPDTTHLEPYFSNLRDSTNLLQNELYNRLERAISQGRSVVFDLMDFTRILQVRLADPQLRPVLAQMGYNVSAAMLGRNLAVDLLSDVLLGEEEMHTALSDAQQQNRLFHKILKMTEEVEDGIVSSDTKAYLEALHNPDNYNRNFLKSLKTQLNDLYLSVTAVKNGSQKTPQEISEELASRLPIVLDRVSNMYRETPSNEFDRQAVLNSVRQYLLDPSVEVNPLDPISVQQASNILDSNTPISNLQPPPNSATQSISTSQQQKLHNTIQSIQRQLDGSPNSPLANMIPPSQVANEASRTLASGIPNKTGIPSLAKWGLVGIGAMAFVNLILSNNGERESKELIRNDTYDALYNNLYAGQAYADWKERNNSHRMLY